MAGAIEGYDDCMKWLGHEAAENMLRASKQAMKEAAKTTTADIRRKTPPRWRRLVKGKVKQLSSGKINAGMGLFNNHHTQGGPHYKKGKQAPEVDDWFKAYWLNYGTREKRDPHHQFIYPRKQHTRPLGGPIAPKHFFEQAISDYQQTFSGAFDRALDNIVNDDKEMYK